MADTSTRKTEHICISRPADGKYQLGGDDTDYLVEFDVTMAIWGRDGLLEGGTNSLSDRVHEALWARTGQWECPAIADFKTATADGYTRPYIHILIDTVDFVKRKPTEKAIRFLKAALGDESLALEFLPVAANCALTVVREEEGNNAQGKPEDLVKALLKTWHLTTAQTNEILSASTAGRIELDELGEILERMKGRAFKTNSSGVVKADHMLAWLYGSRGTKAAQARTEAFLKRGNFMA